MEEMILKKVLVIRDDFYHPKENIDPILRDVFPEREWEMILTDRVRYILENKAVGFDVVVFFTNGIPKGEAYITYEQQDEIVSLVEVGMGIMFVHAGVVLIEADSPFYQKLHSGRFIAHSDEHVLVKTEAIRNINHPIIKNVKPIIGMDEHYFCTVNVDKVDMLMMSSSEEITSVGAWCSQIGKGKSFSIVPGHTEEALHSKEMLRVLKNAVAWIQD